MSESVDTLEAWLGTATDKLTQSGKERIALEITSHFDDAVASYRTDGLAEADARTRALADLGSSKEAAKRFKRRHLTQKEVAFLEKKLDGYREWRKPGMQLAYWIFCALFLTIGYYQLKMQHVPLLLPAIWAVLFLALQRISFSLASRPKVLSLRLLLAFDILSWLCFSVLLGCVTAWPVIGMSFLMYSWLWFPAFRLLLKLGRFADIYQEMLPQKETP